MNSDILLFILILWSIVFGWQIQRLDQTCYRTSSTISTETTICGRSLIHWSIRYLNLRVIHNLGLIKWWKIILFSLYILINALLFLMLQISYRSFYYFRLNTTASLNTKLTLQWGLVFQISESFVFLILQPLLVKSHWCVRRIAIW